MFGAIEAGGTKFLCGVGTGPDAFTFIELPTRTPQETLAEVAAYFRAHPITAIGLGCFGPVDLNRQSPTYGHITATPKLAWRNFDIVGWLERELRVPVAFDTDVNAAALGEGAYGAARGLSDFVYFTVGTGIGGGAVSGGRIVHGAVHPEMGHIAVRRHPQDSFAGLCPSHGDCLEGLASGPAVAARCGVSARQLPADDPAWDIAAYYLAQAAANAAFFYSPEAVVFGGGLFRQQHLLARVQKDYAHCLGGYLSSPAKLRVTGLANAGLVGSLMLASHAADKPLIANGTT
jgi:fructokinase